MFFHRILCFKAGKRSDIVQTFNIEDYMNELIKRLQIKFGNRLIYAGLQGSFSRGEADENSDIDVMVTLDRLDAADLASYREIIAGMPGFERSCGFISGREDLKNWPRHEICQLLHETKDFYGELRPLLPHFNPGDVNDHIGIAVGDLYHLLCHGRIHGKPEQRAESLRGLYKAVFYILQNIFYQRSGKWIRTKSELLKQLRGLDREVMQMALSVRSGKDVDWEKAFLILFDWCEGILKIYGKNISGKR